MSRFGATDLVSKPVHSPFAGLSNGRQTKNSAYPSWSTLEHSLTHIESTIPAAVSSFKLPRVVVVGERSVGKSSLLENFTKCAIFPTGEETCTKMPVRLQIKAVTAMPKYVATVCYTGQPDINLTSMDNILPAVQTLMDQAQGIDANEITIEISQCCSDLDGATFTFVDLPGIQQCPSADSKTSKALVASYLTDATQDTLVFCVVDATTAADLQHNVALGEIAAAGKMGHTLLALTKCDEVQDVGFIIAQICKPLGEFNGCSSKAPGLAGLAGCVAIANRKPEGCTLSLEQFDSNERRIFRDMISSVSLECPGMSASLKAKLADHMTIQQLIIKLDCLYRDYILRHWKPQMPRQVEGGKLTEVQKQMAIKDGLNQITLDNFHQVLADIIAIGFETEETEAGLVDQIFNKALTDTASGGVCARLCFQFHTALPRFAPPSQDANINSPSTFRKLLLNKCQEEFENGRAARDVVEVHTEAEQGKPKQQNLKEQHLAEMETSSAGHTEGSGTVQAQQRACGSLQFVGHLYCEKMLTDKIIHQLIKSLMTDVEAPRQGDIECLVKLMSIVGRTMDKPKARMYLNAYFERIVIFSKNLSLNSQTRLMLQDLIELRRHSWRAPGQDYY